MAEKGVMLADRPPPRLPAGGANASFSSASFGGLEAATSAASLGNYKGVMLCNRPNPTDGMGKAVGAGGDDLPFCVASQHEKFHPNGQNNDVRELLARRATRRREPNQTVLKAREYLRELALKKEDLLRQKEDEEFRAEEKRRRLAESQQALRELIRNNVGGEDGGDEGEGSRGGGGGGSRAYAAPTAAKAAAPSKSGRGTGSAAAAAAGGKPAWARSAAAEAKAEEEEEDELLNFADDLNFDSYERDLETKAGETLVARRLREVEVEEAGERAKLAALEAEEDAAAAKEEAAARRERRRRRARRLARAARRKAREAAAGGDGAEGKKEGEAGDGSSGTEGGGDGEEDYDDGEEEDGSGSSGESDGDAEAAGHGRREPRRRRHASDDDGGGSDDAGGGSDADSLGPLTGGGRRGQRGGNDAGSVADSILSSASSMRGVHSKRSLTAVVSRTQADEAARIAAAVAAGHGRGGGAVEDVEIKPRVVVHNELRPAIEAKKNLVNQLPYQHRNPAV
jgi:hypothetical protein